jgi:Rrf2 family protein
MLPMKSRYALKALVYLAQHLGEGPVLISTVAEAEGIPRKFLEAILLELRNSGILTSRRGKNGGYSLLAKPEDVLLGEVFRVLTGPLAPLPCLSKTAYQRCGDCKDETHCAVRVLLADVHNATLKILDHTTLADLVEKVRDPSATMAAFEAYMGANI